MDKQLYLHLMFSLSTIVLCLLIGFHYGAKVNFLEIIPSILLLLLVYNMSIIMFVVGLKSFSKDIIPIFLAVFVASPIITLILRYVISRYFKYTKQSSILLALYIPSITLSANMGYVGLPIVNLFPNAQELFVNFYLFLMLAVQLQFFIFVYPSLHLDKEAVSLLYQHRFTPIVCYVLGLIVSYVYPGVEVSSVGLFLTSFTTMLKTTHTILGNVLMGMCFRFLTTQYRKYRGNSKNIKYILFFVFVKYGLLNIGLLLIWQLLVLSGYNIAVPKLLCVALLFCLPPALNSLLVLLNVHSNPSFAESEFLADLTLYFFISTIVGILLSLGILVIAYIVV